MTNSDKFNAAAAQARVQASELASAVREKADELIAKATPAVSEAADKAGEYATKAAVAAAGQVDTVAAGLKSMTSGRGAETIDIYGAKLKKLLDPAAARERRAREGCGP